LPKWNIWSVIHGDKNYLMHFAKRKGMLPIRSVLTMLAVSIEHAHGGQILEVVKPFFLQYITNTLGWGSMLQHSDLLFFIQWNTGLGASFEFPALKKSSWDKIKVSATNYNYAS